MSSCLTDVICAFDNTANGEFPNSGKRLIYDTVKVVKFCLEECFFGSFRARSDNQNGMGFGVL
jgi:hypothetical protein